MRIPEGPNPIILAGQERRSTGLAAGERLNPSLAPYVRNGQRDEQPTVRSPLPVM